MTALEHLQKMFGTLRDDSIGVRLRQVGYRMFTVRISIG
jgi:hypothetical protein